MGRCRASELETAEHKDDTRPWSRQDCGRSNSHRCACSGVSCDTCAPTRRIHTAVRALACPATRALPLAGHASRFRPAAAARPGLDCAPAACHGLGETPDLPQRKSRNPARPGMQERSLRLGTALHQWSNFGLGVSGVLHRGPSLQQSPARRGCSEGHTRWLARHEARHRCLRRA